MSFLSEILEGAPIPEDKLIYFRERLQHRLHSAILDAYLVRSKQYGLKQKDLAARIHRTSAQITRWFSAASNLTLDSISDLMVGLGMDFDGFPFTRIEKTVEVALQSSTKQHVDLASIIEKARNIGSDEASKNSAIISISPTTAAVVRTPLSTTIETIQQQPPLRRAQIYDFAEEYQKRRAGQSDTFMRKIGAGR